MISFRYLEDSVSGFQTGGRSRPFLGWLSLRQGSPNYVKNMVMALYIISITKCSIVTEGF